MFTEKRQALPTHSAAEQFPFGALCEPASLLIYLLGKEVTIAVITGRCVSKSGGGLSKCSREGVAEPAPQETAIKSLCLEWCRDSSPSVGLRPRAGTGEPWDLCTSLLRVRTAGKAPRWQTPLILCPCRRHAVGCLILKGPLEHRHFHSEVSLVYEVWVGGSDGAP